eukprot:CAMPEP_0198204318 /NCGR_PEP_ID=MMETSP1445-20131203/7718_1 /TAXON_ID=36898 /ORGANISM="Pyramimonas sp., Strain CCMP2087" /LENGTH=66 /DNA_ID=CAMNT_0043876133 /DNA_START=257 /DNA_END=457 /DNA_ORIENTATION=-
MDAIAATTIECSLNVPWMFPECSLNWAGAWAPGGPNQGDTEEAEPRSDGGLGPQHGRPGGALVGRV